MRRDLLGLSGSYGNSSRREAIFLELVREAADAQQYGVNHRPVPFLVGVAALRRKYNVLSGRFEYSVDADANNKPLKKGGPRFCGEEYIVERARKGGYEILWFVIFAPPQKDDYVPELFCDDSHSHHRTLKSCGYCRTMFNDKLLRARRRRLKVITRHTLITSVNCETGEDHHYSIDWLVRHYGVPDARWVHE